MLQLSFSLSGASRDRPVIALLLTGWFPTVDEDVDGMDEHQQSDDTQTYIHL